jgi:hypothetical protein
MISAACAEISFTLSIIFDCGRCYVLLAWPGECTGDHTVAKSAMRSSIAVHCGTTAAMPATAAVRLRQRRLSLSRPGQRGLKRQDAQARGPPAALLFASPHQARSGHRVACEGLVRAGSVMPPGASVPGTRWLIEGVFSRRSTKLTISVNFGARQDGSGGSTARVMLFRNSNG